MSGLVEFLRARLTQDETWATTVLDDPAAWDLHGFARRYLAEAESKLAILAAHPVTRDVITVQPDGTHGFGCATCHQDEGVIVGDGWCVTLRALASVYADHPDYREEWRP